MLPQTYQTSMGPVTLSVMRRTIELHDGPYYLGRVNRKSSVMASDLTSCQICMFYETVGMAFTHWTEHRKNHP
jgi:hypothetical protein